jgi:hypothetical protein
MLYFGTHVLSPLSFAIRIDLQLGNIPACFFELRMILESMGKCYWADIDYPELEDFMDKLKAQDQKSNKKSKSISKLLEEMGHDYVALWGKLSNEWLHTEGFIKRINNYILANACIPGYALGSPMDYNEEDIGTINELGLSISKFRLLLKETRNKWSRELNLEGVQNEHKT